MIRPILKTEAVRIARSRWWYVLRTCLGLGFLLLIYVSYSWTFGGYGGYGYALRGGGSYSHQELIDLSMRMLAFIGMGQGLCILIQVPALVAGAIAEDKQRKTLHYLLSSRLNSAEIVLEKLASRLLVLAVPIAIGFPVLAMLGVFGGIDFPIL